MPFTRFVTAFLLLSVAVASSASAPAGALAAGGPGLLAPAKPAPLIEEAGLVLHVQPLLVMGDQSGALAAKRLEVDPTTGGLLEFELQWPAPEVTSRLRVRASGRIGPPDGEHSVTVESELTLPDGRRVRSLRSLMLGEGTAGFFEVYREGDQGLTLALTVEREVRRFALARKSVGDPVTFRLEVESVRGDQISLLETNHLNTFVGEQVEYSFQRGQGETAESVRLLLRPVRLEGDLVEISVEISGSLPGGESRLVLSRRERLFSSRRVTSSLIVTTGTPPAGYRFRITPIY